MKRERWIKFTVLDPSTGTLTQISAPMGKSCPSCGQSRCTKRSDLCIQVQAAWKAGQFEIFTV